MNEDDELYDRAFEIVSRDPFLCHATSVTPFEICFCECHECACGAVVAGEWDLCPDCANGVHKGTPIGGER